MTSIYFLAIIGTIGDSMRLEIIFVILDTVDFCLRKARSFVEYLPPHLDEKPIKHSVDTGFCVSFCFVHGYGSTTTFGKDKNIFYE